MNTNPKTPIPAAIFHWWEKMHANWESLLKSNKNTPFKGYLYNTLEGVTGGFNGSAKLANLAACITNNHRGMGTTHLSIFVLLGSISELMALDEVARKGDTLKSELRRLAQLRTYQAPPWQSQDKSGSTTAADLDYSDGDDATLHNNEDGKLFEVNEVFFGYLEVWLENAAIRRIDLIPSIYARIVTRLYYTLTRMDENFSLKNIYAGSVFHRQIVAFLNAVLVEEMLARRPGMKLTLDNPTLSDNPFWLNYPFRERTKEEVGITENVDGSTLPLFDLMFSCPIFGLFLQPTSTLKHTNGVDKMWSVKDDLRVRASLWEEQLSRWPTLTQDVTEIEHRKDSVALGMNEIKVENLWAPLNSVPVLKGKMQKPVWSVLKKVATSQTNPNITQSETEMSVTGGVENSSAQNIASASDAKKNRIRRTNSQIAADKNKSTTTVTMLAADQKSPQSELENQSVDAEDEFSSKNEVTPAENDPDSTS